MKALLCDRCNRYYHEQLDGYKNQCNLSILDAETAGPERRLDLCQDCKRELEKFLEVPFLPNEQIPETPAKKKAVSASMILHEYERGKSFAEISEKFGIQANEVKKAIDKFR